MAVVPAGPQEKSPVDRVDLAVALGALGVFCALPGLGAPMFVGPVVLLGGLAAVAGRAARRRRPR